MKQILHSQIQSVSRQDLAFRLKFYGAWSCSLLLGFNSSCYASLPVRASSDSFWDETTCEALFHKEASVSELKEARERKVFTTTLCTFGRKLQKLRFSPGNLFCHRERKDERPENIYTCQVRGEMPTFCCFPQHVYKATSKCGDDQRV